MTGALVGPLPTIRFDGATRERQAYTVPRHTGVLAARLCTDHHPACDCREAELNEQIQEFRYERAELGKAMRETLIGHVIYAPRGAPDDACCMCSGCRIARASWAFPFRYIDHITGRVL